MYLNEIWFFLLGVLLTGYAVFFMGLAFRLTRKKVE